MRKIVLAVLMFLGSTSVVKAEAMDVDLGQMFSDYKDNEYSFKQKYLNKDLKFTAIVSSVDASCYTDWNGNGTPCIKLEHKTYKVAYLHVIPTNIGKALMYDNNDLTDLQKQQEITLICRLKSSEALLETDPLVFENCKLDGKEYPDDEKLKEEVINDKVNELDIIDEGNCGTNCHYQIDNKGLLLIKPIDSSTRADVQKGAFKERKDFAKVKIEEGIVSIGDDAFQSTNLVKAELPNGITYIGDGAFKSTKLTKINLPDTLTAIGSGEKYLGNGTFERTKLKKIKIPDSITVINDNTFKWNDWKEVILPKNLKVIGSNAFNCWNYDNLKNIVIPDTVTSIGEEAFEGCEIESLKLPESLETLGNYAFKETEIKNLELPKSLKTIPHYAFAYTKISELNVPDSVIFIDEGAFREAKLSYLIISDTTEVADEAFKDATIGTVYCRGDVDTCKENLEDAVPETTEFVSLEELRIRQEAEARAKAEEEARAKAEKEARAREEAEARAKEEAEALAKEQETSSNNSQKTTGNEGKEDFGLDSTSPTQTVDKNIFINKDLMKTITPEQLKEYIAMGGDVNASDSKGTTALMVASLYSSNPQILEILIDNGSALESKRENGWTALTIAARYNTKPKVIQTLLDKGATIQNKQQLLSLLNKNQNIEKNQDYWDLRDKIYNEINR